MPYNGATNGSGGGGGGGGLIVSDGPQNKKIRTGVQQSGEGDAHMHARVSKRNEIKFVIKELNLNYFQIFVEILSNHPVQESGLLTFYFCKPPAFYTFIYSILDLMTFRLLFTSLT